MAALGREVGARAEERGGLHLVASYVVALVDARVGVPETPVIYEDVELLEPNGLGYTVRIGNERVFVGKYVPLTGMSIHTKGDRGRLALPRWFVEQQGLPLDKHLSDVEVEAWYASARLRADAADEYFAAHSDDKEAEAELNRATDALSTAMLLRARRQRPR